MSERRNETEIDGQSNKLTEIECVCGREGLGWRVEGTGEKYKKVKGIGE